MTRSVDARLKTGPKPNLKLVGDITCIPTRHGWLYLAVVIDLFSRRVVGWAMADHMRSELVCNAFKMALCQRSLTAETLFHSDRAANQASADGGGFYAENGTLPLINLLLFGNICERLQR